MEAKFTKGEWLVSDNKINSPVRHIVKMPSSKPTKYNGTMYACIGGFECETQTDEAEANAHLIAAAPDMYKELELHLIAWENMYPSDISYVDDMHIEEFKAIHKFINGTKELLVKARGE